MCVAVFKQEFNLEENTLKLSCDKSLFNLGRTLVVTIINKSKISYESLYINFSNESKPIFSSEEKALLYAITDKDKYIIRSDIKNMESENRSPSSGYHIYDSNGDSLHDEDKSIFIQVILIIMVQDI